MENVVKMAIAQKVAKAFFIGLGAVVLIGVIAIGSGTILWLIWPVAIPAAFPGLVASGVIAGRLSWWVSVCLTWIFEILIKASQSNRNKSE
jgi:hypothetical protein